MLRTRRLKNPQTNSLTAETALITHSVGKAYESRTDQLTRLKCEGSLSTNEINVVASEFKSLGKQNQATTTVTTS